jgi:hypothetical protein
LSGLEAIRIARAPKPSRAQRRDTTDFFQLLETYFAPAPSAIFTTMPKIKNLECSHCHETVSAETPQTL